MNFNPNTMLFSSLSSEMAKQFCSCNWVPSPVTEAQLAGCVATGALANKDTIHWRVPGPEFPLKPQDGEVIVFVDHMNRGFSPPGSKFFRDVLHLFQLHPKTLDPIPSQISAISKSSAKYIFKRNPVLNSL